MENLEIGDFKYPSRTPIILIILLVIAGVAGVRWYRGGGGAQLSSDGKASRWSCSVFQRKDKAAEQKPPVAAAKPEKQMPVSGLPATSSGRSINSAPGNPAQGGAGASAPAPAPALASIAAAPVQVADTNSPAALQEIVALEDGRDFLQARKKYLELLRKPIDGKTREEAEKRLGKINIELVLTPSAMPWKQEYIVKSGDSLDRIARKFATTVELIQKSNLLGTHVIKAGDRLMVLAGKFALRISKAGNSMVVTLNDEFFCRYGVGTGKFGKTPIGSFVINDKIKEPVWWRPDGREIPFGNPENILGTRWMSIKAGGAGTPDVRGYGIHGTWDEGSIGKAESAGCIRMRNSEVEQLFAMVPVGTVVTISE